MKIGKFYITRNNPRELLKKIKQQQDEKDNLMKYLMHFINELDYEVNIKGNYGYLSWANAYKDLLERVKSGKYE